MFIKCKYAEQNLLVLTGDLKLLLSLREVALTDSKMGKKTQFHFLIL